MAQVNQIRRQLPNRKYLGFTATVKRDGRSQRWAFEKDNETGVITAGAIGDDNTKHAVVGPDKYGPTFGPDWIREFFRQRESEGYIDPPETNEPSVLSEKMEPGEDTVILRLNHKAYSRTGRESDTVSEWFYITPANGADGRVRYLIQHAEPGRNGWYRRAEDTALSMSPDRAPDSLQWEKPWDTHTPYPIHSGYLADFNNGVFNADWVTEWITRRYADRNCTAEIVDKDSVKLPRVGRVR